MQTALKLLNTLGWVVSLVFIAAVSNHASVTYTPGIPMARTYWEGIPYQSNYVIDLVGDPAVDALARAGRLFEDNIFSKEPVKFVYSSKTNRPYSQAGISIQEDNDPVDYSSTRIPAKGVEGLSPWTLISQFGARSWFVEARHYGAAVQYHAIRMRDGTVAMCLSTAPGVDGETRYSGHNDNGQHLVCQVLIMPNGDTVFGYNTDPNYTPKIMFQGQPYFDTSHPPAWFHGDAWSYLASGVEESEGRNTMKTQMLKDVK